MPYIDQANIACGFHASDPANMVKTIKLACQHHVEIGAHPSYPDKENFGRLSMNLDSNELIAIIQYQVAALQNLCANENTQVSYVKPHGALYNDMMADLAIFSNVCQAINQSSSLLPDKMSLMIQALPDQQAFIDIAQQWQVPLIFEAFADRAYQDNGLLVSRQQKNAVLLDEQIVVKRMAHLAAHQQLLSINDKALTLNVDSICVHGDNSAAIKLIKALRVELDA
jgi:UPF0271 protein